MKKIKIVLLLNEGRRILKMRMYAMWHVPQCKCINIWPIDKNFTDASTLIYDQLTKTLLMQVHLYMTNLPQLYWCKCINIWPIYQNFTDASALIYDQLTKNFTDASTLIYDQLTKILLM